MSDATATIPTIFPREVAQAPDRPLLPLVARDLRLVIDGRDLVDVEELTIRDGGPTVVMGPNGAGKSLLLRLLHGLSEPTTGTICWNGAVADEAARARQAMVFQRPVLLRRSVAANVDYVLKLRGVARAERPRRVTSWLDLAGLGDLARQPARTLSGGEQQRLAMVRALATEPRILFLDEPTASLDPASTHAIESLIRTATGNGAKIVMITHDVGQAKRLAEDVVFIHRGRVLEHGPATDFFNQPRSDAARAFLAGGLVI
ncbi:ATP-binding cassette domain-containing protein [Tepidamorphus sp. 3E244]|uniref:ATP-binding cassette domain-containing protein n=1 Tax=Tepidamorphus sp. 3E244 TaxID=3385498 RepID=UPI0038FD0138